MSGRSCGPVASWERRRFLAPTLILLLIPGAARANWGPYPPVAPISTAPLSAERVVVPMVFPVLGVKRWSRSYNQHRGSYRHTGVDIPAAKMTPVLAPISGQLGLKEFSFWIIGEGRWEGWRILGTHLNDDTPGTNDGAGARDFMFAPNLRPHDRVRAGQLIGYVGDSTNATGPHLHLELHGRRGVVDPTPSLHAAQHRSAPLPVLGSAVDRPGAGEYRIDGVPRGYEPVTRTLTVLVVARQGADGRVITALAPEFRRIHLPKEVETDLGGLEGIAGLPRDRAVRFYIPWHPGRPAGARLAVAPEEERAAENGPRTEASREGRPGNRSRAGTKLAAAETRRMMLDPGGPPRDASAR